MVETGLLSLSNPNYDWFPWKSDKYSIPQIFLNDIPILSEDSVKILDFGFDTTLTWKPHIDMIVSKAKQCSYVIVILCSSVPRLCWIVTYVQSFHLDYSHLFYYGAANTHLYHLDPPQCCAESNCSTTFPSLFSHRKAAAIGLICRFLDGEGHGNLQFFCPYFVV